MDEQTLIYGYSRDPERIQRIQKFCATPACGGSVRGDELWCSDCDKAFQARIAGLHELEDDGPA